MVFYHDGKILFLQRAVGCDGGNIGDDKGILESDTPPSHSDHLSDLNIFSGPQMKAKTLSFNSEHGAIGVNIARGFNMKINNSPNFFQRSFPSGKWYFLRSGWLIAFVKTRPCVMLSALSSASDKKQQRYPQGAANNLLNVLILLPFQLNMILWNRVYFNDCGGAENTF